MAYIIIDKNVNRHIPIQSLHQIVGLQKVFNLHIILKIGLHKLHAVTLSQGNKHNNIKKMIKKGRADNNVSRKYKRQTQTSLSKRQTGISL